MDFKQSGLQVQMLQNESMLGFIVAAHPKMHFSFIGGLHVQHAMRLLRADQ